MRYFLLIYIFVIVAVISILGFRGSTSTEPPLRIFPDMDEQARVKPQAYSKFYVDHREDRPLIKGTVAMIPEHLKAYAQYDTFVEDSYLSTGMVGYGEERKYGTGYPMPPVNDGHLIGSITLLEKSLDRVGRWFDVRHIHNRRDAPRSRRLRGGQEVLLVRIAGVTCMRVGVDGTWQNHETGCVQLCESYGTF